MKKTILLVTIIFISFSCKEKTTEPIAETTVETVQEKGIDSNSEWIALFDGTSLDNWRGYLMKDMPAEWTIEDGAMAFTPGEKGGKNIISKDQYTNFILSLEWKISEGGNSGIFWGVHEGAAFPEAYQTGPEIQVLDNEKHPDAKVVGGTHTAGSLYDMIAPPSGVTNPVGEWNLCELEVNHKTNQGKVTLNGTELFTFAVNGTDWDGMVANSKFKDWEGFGKFQTGHIGLQDHGDKVWYRNIKIKNLD
ncbi:MAG: DUF1080 domain-containing protein [Flavobacteriaceae bacterium]|nr:DUF1080 domain-containing protein [Flavobacteriaceae bacterium]